MYESLHYQINMLYKSLYRAHIHSSIYGLFSVRNSKWDLEFPQIYNLYTFRTAILKKLQRNCTLLFSSYAMKNMKKFATDRNKMNHITM